MTLLCAESRAPTTRDPGIGQTKECLGPVFHHFQRHFGVRGDRRRKRDPGPGDCGLNNAACRLKLPTRSPIGGRRSEAVRIPPSPSFAFRDRSVPLVLLFLSLIFSFSWTTCCGTCQLGILFFRAIKRGFASVFGIKSRRQTRTTSRSSAITRLPPSPGQVIITYTFKLTYFTYYYFLLGELRAEVSPPSFFP